LKRSKKKRWSHPENIRESIPKHKQQNDCNASLHPNSFDVQFIFQGLRK
jgi:hypothetical protein